MSKLKKCASELAKLEGKKSQAKIGDIRELLSKLVDLEVEHLMSGGVTEDGYLYALANEVDKRVQKLLKKKK